MLEPGDEIGQHEWAITTLRRRIADARAEQSTAVA